MTSADVLAVERSAAGRPHVGQHADALSADNSQPESEKPHAVGWSAEYPLALAARVASRFDIASPIEVYDFVEKGNINRHTFLVQSGPGGKTEYLLQEINQRVFVRPRSVMGAMMAVIDAQKANYPAMASSLVDGWEAITLVPGKDGSPYLEIVDRRGLTCWRLMVKIEDAVTYKSLSEIADKQERLRIASEAGRGLALYGDLTSTVDATRLNNPLPGYRNTRIYYDQLKSVLAGNRSTEQAADCLPKDDVLLRSTGQHFLVHCSEQIYQTRLADSDLADYLALIDENREYGLTLARELEQGSIRTVAIHGDTKLDNFLFSASTGRVKALVDLDTIMPHTWLSDWGDMARSLVNVAGEKCADLSAVEVDMDIYRSLATGFLSAANQVTDREVELMVDAVMAIALELGVRFLTDYLRGDNYFQLGPADPPELNKTRAMVQLTLFRKLREAVDECRAFVKK